MKNPTEKLPLWQEPVFKNLPYGILRKKTNLTAFHMSGKSVKNSKMQFRNPNVFMGLPGMSEYEIWETDSNAVLAVRKLLS